MEEVPEKEVRTWGMACHLAALSGFVIPFGSIIGPLVIWLMKKDTMPFVDDQGKEALNFNISIAIYAIISTILIFLFIGILFLIAVIIVQLIFTIIAAVKANEGFPYRYPLTIRFIR